MTFKATAATHIAANKESWRNAKHKQQWENTLKTYAYPVIGDLPVAEVDTLHVLKVLEPIWREVPETASRLRGRIETVLDSAKARADTGKARTPLAGADIWRKSSPPAQNCHAAITMPCPMMRSPPLSSSYRSARRLPRWRWSLSSLQPRGPARLSQPGGARSIWPRRFGPYQPSA